LSFDPPMSMARMFMDSMSERTTALPVHTLPDGPPYRNRFDPATRSSTKRRAPRGTVAVAHQADRRGGDAGQVPTAGRAAASDRIGPDPDRGRTAADRECSEPSWSDRVGKHSPCATLRGRAPGFVEQGWELRLRGLQSKILRRVSPDLRGGSPE